MSLDFKGQGQARDRNLGVLQSPDWTRSPGARVWSEARGVLGPPVLKVKPALRLTGSGQKGRRRARQVNVLEGRRRRCFRSGGESGHLGPGPLRRWLPAWGMNGGGGGGSGWGDVAGPRSLPMASSGAASDGSSASDAAASSFK